VKKNDRLADTILKEMEVEEIEGIRGIEGVE
jgi:hypothetical protein